MRMVGIKKKAYLGLYSLYRRRLAPLQEVFFRLLPTLDFSASTPGVMIDNSDDIRPLPSCSETRYWVP